jgi:hypothetical protein
MEGVNQIYIVLIHENFTMKLPVYANKNIKKNEAGKRG